MKIFLSFREPYYIHCKNRTIPSDNPASAIATPKNMVVVIKPNIPYCSFVNNRVNIGNVMKENSCTAIIPVK